MAQAKRGFEQPFIQMDFELVGKYLRLKKKNLGACQDLGLGPITTDVSGVVCYTSRVLAPDAGVPDAAKRKNVAIYRQKHVVILWPRSRTVFRFFF